MKTIIYMVRHAESPYSKGSERTRGLTREGMLNANKVTKILMDEGIDMIISSPYARAVLTVEGLAKQLNLDIEIFEDLRERHFIGDDVIISDKQFMTAFIDKFDDHEFALPGGESNRDCQNRAVEVLKNIIEGNKGKKIVIGTHGNVMIMMINYFDSSYGYDFLDQTTKPDIYKMVFEGLELIEVSRLWNDLRDNHDIT